MIERAALYALAIALGLSMFNAWTLHGRLQAERLAHQQTKTIYANLLGKAQEQRADEEARRRQAEQELNHAIEQYRTEAAADALGLDSARDRATAAERRVRDAAAAAARRARAQCADSAATGVREAAEDPIGVLADVLGRADARAGILADLADRRYLAGSACEGLYDNARQKLTGTAINTN